MLKKTGNRWISENDEGTFYLTQEEVYFEIPIQLLELLKQAESGDEQADIDNASKANDLYNASSNLSPNWVFFEGMTRTCVMPLLDAISKDNQPPRTCEIIALYAVREMWKRICNYQDTEMLWELFSFYRDKVFPLTLRNNLIECEQYARIAYAFYRVTGYSGDLFGVPIISILNNTYRDKISYGAALERYKENGGNVSSNKEPTISDMRDEMFSDLVQIPKLIADKAFELSKNVYICDVQKQEYLATQKGFDIVQQIANTSYDMLDDVMQDSSITQFYKEYLEHERYGICFTIASFLGKNTERNNIAAKEGNYSLNSIEQNRDILGILAIPLDLVITITVIIGTVYLINTGQSLIAIPVAMVFMLLQSLSAVLAKHEHVIRNNSIYYFVWAFSTALPLIFIARRGHFILTLILVLMFYMTYDFKSSNSKNTTLYIISCSMKAVFPCIFIYLNCIYEAIILILILFIATAVKFKVVRS